MAHILTIEDDSDIALSHKHILERDGDHAVTVAADGTAGLRAALAQPVPNLVLLDLNLPGMDGTEVCRRIRKEPAPKIRGRATDNACACSADFRDAQPHFQRFRFATPPESAKTG